MNNGWLGFSLSPSAGTRGGYGGGGASRSGDAEGSCSSPAASSPLVAMPLHSDGPPQYSSAPGNSFAPVCREGSWFSIQVLADDRVLLLRLLMLIIWTAMCIFF